MNNLKTLSIRLPKDLIRDVQIRALQEGGKHPGPAHTLQNILGPTCIRRLQEYLERPAVEGGEAESEEAPHAEAARSERAG